MQKCVVILFPFWCMEREIFIFHVLLLFILNKMNTDKWRHLRFEFIGTGAFTWTLRTAECLLNSEYSRCTLVCFFCTRRAFWSHWMKVVLYDIFITSRHHSISHSEIRMVHLSFIQSFIFFHVHIYRPIECHNVPSSALVEKIIRHLFEKILNITFFKITDNEQLYHRIFQHIFPYSCMTGHCTYYISIHMHTCKFTQAMCIAFFSEKYCNILPVAITAEGI